MAGASSKVSTWYKTIDDESFTITTDNSQLDRTFINTAFASEDMYWAKKLPIDHLETMLAHSINLGLYKLPLDPSIDTDPPSRIDPYSGSKNGTVIASDEATPQTLSHNHDSQNATGVPKQIGFARLSTDFITLVYLTDVYVAPEHRRKGHASWLIECCDAMTKTLPALRNVLLVAGDDVKDFYKARMGMKDVREEKGWTIMHRREWDRKGL